ncbi:S-methyl-5-thioribose kinase [Paenibacillus sp. ACRRX]|uniref:S-methyl-5-thioribose kinase n=1 Tax=Paenibacillus sp. ACRRX TaxID=2918206 RepID=UPI001EF58ADF|nr:S-methyl-5-thioribose kinase [Paenibacillus sp. ACRRX]MCG7405823.1 S-methyl-5-thioribose kinase [Paenibacillus sp. ACRRX]
MIKATTYHPLSVEDAIEVARNLKGFFTPGSELRCEEIGDGNLNLVFRIQALHANGDLNKSIIIKQALPYAKVVGESWPLTIDRARIESEALLLQGKSVPELVPQVYLFDADMAMTVMEDLSDHVIMRQGLIAGTKYPLFAEHISEFLAQTLFSTSDLGMNQQDKKRQVEKFINPELCKITEDLIFDDPYTNSSNNNIDSAILDEHTALCSDQSLQFEVMLLRQKFLSQSQALLHGDLHTGSIFITPASTKVIDPEFAYYGPMGFDIGAVIGNLLLNAAGQQFWIQDVTKREQYRDYLLTTIRDIWNLFEMKFRTLWNQHGVDRLSTAHGYQDHYLLEVLRDTAGYAGCKMIRRIVGLAHVADIDTIPDTSSKEQAQRTALSIGKALVTSNRSIHSIDELIDAANQAFKGVHVS